MNREITSNSLYKGVTHDISFQYSFLEVILSRIYDKCSCIKYSMDAYKDICNI